MDICDRLNTLCGQAGSLTITFESETEETFSIDFQASKGSNPDDTYFLGELDKETLQEKLRNEQLVTLTDESIKKELHSLIKNIGARIIDIIKKETEHDVEKWYMDADYPNTHDTQNWHLDDGKGSAKENVAFYQTSYSRGESILVRMFIGEYGNDTFELLRSERCASMDFTEDNGVVITLPDERINGISNKNPHQVCLGADPGSLRIRFQFML